IYNNPKKSVFLHRYADWVRYPLSLNYLNETSSLLLGEHDFKSFQSVGTPVPHTVRTIYSARWRQLNNDVLEFRITGSGFLKQMVRNIVGTQLFLERKSEKPEKIREIMDLKDRTQAGPPAPPQGLYLCRVYYPLELDNKCRKL
ncbi:MAG: tRNA pseudouridine(38-40) synthase TruA, partial [Bdellovibrionales bacterium]|nr:tRNA pseudouridine(38-40) synthase TruA [Bdellovibrionales bacterium]